MGIRAVTALALLVGACSGPIAGGRDGSAVAEQSVGGTLSGLGGGGPLVLGLLAQRLTLTANGPFTFPTPLSAGQAYEVQVIAPSPHQSCAVTHGSGAIVAGSDVTDVAVSCAAQLWAMGGSVSGLGAGGLTLSETVSLQSVWLDAGAAVFEFPSPSPFGAAYEVQVTGTPAGHACTVDGGAGTVMDQDVRSIAVECELRGYPLSGTVVGLDAGGLTLAEVTTQQLFGLDAGATSFTFAQLIRHGTLVSTTVAVQPDHTLCRVSHGAAVMTGPKSDVQVDCKRGFTVGGTVSGATSGVQLREADTGQLLDAFADGGTGFVFPLVVPAGESFTVTVASPPLGQSCTVVGGTGVSSADYSGVRVDCFHATRDLVINELSAAPDPAQPVWLELYNGTAAPKNLAAYRLSAGSRALDGGPGSGAAVFDLPDASVPAGGYLVLSSRPYGDLWDGPQLRFIAGGQYTFWFGDGGADVVQLQLAGGAAVDAVAFGPAAALPLAEWRGAAAALPQAPLARIDHRERDHRVASRR